MRPPRGGDSPPRRTGVGWKGWLLDRRGGDLAYMYDHPSFENLAMTADQRLYRSIVHNPNHVLRRFFLEKAPTGHNLRPRAHNFVLSIKDNNNFVPRILYNELIT